MPSCVDERRAPAALGVSAAALILGLLGTGVAPLSVRAEAIGRVIHRAGDTAPVAEPDCLNHPQFKGSLYPDVANPGPGTIPSVVFLSSSAVWIEAANNVPRGQDLLATGAGSPAVSRDGAVVAYVGGGQVWAMSSSGDLAYAVTTGNPGNVGKPKVSGDMGGGTYRIIFERGEDLSGDNNGWADVYYRDVNVEGMPVTPAEVLVGLGRAVHGNLQSITNTEALDVSQDGSRILLIGDWGLGGREVLVRVGVGSYPSQGTDSLAIQNHVEIGRVSWYTVVPGMSRGAGMNVYAWVAGVPDQSSLLYYRDLDLHARPQPIIIDDGTPYHITGVHFPRVSADGRFVLFAFSDPRLPPPLDASGGVGVALWDTRHPTNTEPDAFSLVVDGGTAAYSAPRMTADGCYFSYDVGANATREPCKNGVDAPRPDDISYPACNDPPDDPPNENDWDPRPWHAYSCKFCGCSPSAKAYVVQTCDGQGADANCPGPLLGVCPDYPDAYNTFE